MVNSESNSSDKQLKKDNSSSQTTKMAPSERLRPIGASAEEEVCEGRNRVSTDTKPQEAGGERSVHIVIKSQQSVGSDRSSGQSEQLSP